jgi:hypothetical protein
MSRFLRSAATVVATPLLLVLYLNIEVLAAKRGWDTVLSAWAPAMTEFVTQPWVFAVAAFGVGIAIGAWVHWLAIRVDRRPTEPAAAAADKSERERLAARAIEISKSISDLLGRFHGELRQAFDNDSRHFQAGIGFSDVEHNRVQGKIVDEFCRRIEGDVLEVLTAANRFVFINSMNWQMYRGSASLSSIEHLKLLLHEVAAELRYEVDQVVSLERYREGLARREARIQELEVKLKDAKSLSQAPQGSEGGMPQ